MTDVNEANFCNDIVKLFIYNEKTGIFRPNFEGRERTQERERVPKRLKIERGSEERW